VSAQETSDAQPPASVSGAAHCDALGRLCVALNDAGVEPSFESAFAMLELAYLNLRAAGVPGAAIRGIVSAIEACHEGATGMARGSRAH
jgi:hypothetical protein